MYVHSTSLAFPRMTSSVGCTVLHWASQFATRLGFREILGLSKHSYASSTLLCHISNVFCLGAYGIVSCVTVFSHAPAIMIMRFPQPSRHRSCYWQYPSCLGKTRAVSPKLLMELQTAIKLVSLRSPQMKSACIHVVRRGSYVSVS